MNNITDAVKTITVCIRLCYTVDKTSDVCWDQSMFWWWRQHLSLDRRLIDDTVCSWKSLSTTKQFILTTCQ